MKSDTFFHSAALCVMLAFLMISFTVGSIVFAENSKSNIKAGAAEGVIFIDNKKTYTKGNKGYGGSDTDCLPNVNESAFAESSPSDAPETKHGTSAEETDSAEAEAATVQLSETVAAVTEAPTASVPETEYSGESSYGEIEETEYVTESASAPEAEETAVIPAGGAAGCGGCYYDIPLGLNEQEVVIKYCEMYGVPLELVYGIMFIESTYRSNLVSETCDYGIMQINQCNHASLSGALGITDFLDFEQNVHAGVYMLSGYYHKYYDINKIAMCYHYGEGGAGQMWSQGIYSTEYTQRLVCAMANLTVQS